MNKSEQSKAVEELYILYEQPMYRIAYAILHNPEQAEDAVQDAFVAVLKSQADLHNPRSPEVKHYMVQAIRSAAINRYRQNSTDAGRLAALDSMEIDIPDSKNDVEERMVRIEQREIVSSILSGLTASEREILRLRCVEELSFKEIGQRLSLSEATVRKRFERARKSARKQKGAIIYGKEIFTP